MADTSLSEISELFFEIGRARGMSTAPAWMELQLTLPQFKMLVAVSKAESSTVGGIAEQLGVGESTTSYLVDRLVQAELVMRSDDPSDRRKARISLSPRGRSLLDKLVGPKDWLNEHLRGLGAEDLAALHRGLKAVAAILRSEIPA